MKSKIRTLGFLILPTAALWLAACGGGKIVVVPTPATPLTGNNWPGTVEIEGQPAAGKASDQISLPLRNVMPGYFEVLRLGISDGRDFRSTDTANAPRVAVVNQALADRYFPKANPIGKNSGSAVDSNLPACGRHLHFPSIWSSEPRQTRAR